MPSSFLRIVGLIALAYFIFFVPIGRDKTLANHAAELWGKAQMRRALELQSQEIKHDIVVRLNQWRDSRKPHGGPEAVDIVDSLPPPQGAAIHSETAAPPKHRRAKKAHSRPAQSTPPPQDGDAT